MKQLTEEEYKQIYGINGVELDEVVKEFADSECACTTLLEHITKCKLKNIDNAL